MPLGSWCLSVCVCIYLSVCVCVFVRCVFRWSFVECLCITHTPITTLSSYGHTLILLINYHYNYYSESPYDHITTTLTGPLWTLTQRCGAGAEPLAVLHLSHFNPLSGLSSAADLGSVEPGPDPPVHSQINLERDCGQLWQLTPPSSQIAPCSLCGALLLTALLLTRAL